MIYRSQVVILIHGIRDFALWQNSVRNALEEAGMAVEAINYGRFNLLEFLSPIAFFRKRAIEKVWRQIRIVRQNNPQADISVIAHSFGTYVVAQLMKENFDIKFHRILFCGSVVPYDFPFEQIQDRFHPPIINEVGARDIWPAIAESITSGYGSAGTYGFRRPLVRDRWHRGAQHNFFLEQSFCRQFWVPLLREGRLIPGAELPEAPRMWLQLLSILKIRWFLLAMILALVVGSLFAGTKYFARGLDQPSPDHRVAQVIEPELPSLQSYCSDLKEVIAAVPRQFDALLGQRLGNNRVATFPLSGWEDCIVFMESQFTNSRRYRCTLSGFSNAGVTIRSGEEIAKGITTQCMGHDFSYNRVPYPDGTPRFRVVGRGTTASVVITPSKDPLSMNWNISLDVE